MASTKSRAALVKRAVRPELPARMMISGPAGSGKTWTALVIARTIVGPEGRIIVIDTETESALTYADEFEFDHLPWGEPFDPRELADTIRDLGTDPGLVIIVDSLSHFWTGEGGTLDIADGKFGGWKTATPAQDEMVQAMLRSRSHILACTREKQQYGVEEVMEGGRKKQKVEKLGLAPIQREGLDYEFNVAVSIDMTHSIIVHKTRCRRLADRSYRPNHADELAETYKEWLDGGHPVITKEQADELRARAMALPGEADGSDIRKRCLGIFKESFGSADQLLTEDLEEASALIATFELEAWPDGKPAPAPAPPAEDPPPSDRAAVFDAAMTEAEAQIADVKAAQVGEPPVDVRQDDPPEPDDPTDGDPGPVDPQMELTS